MISRLLNLLRKRCPQCQQRGLRARNWIRATCVDAEGRRYPDSWTYFSCDACGARLRWHLGGRVSTPTPEEWESFCSDANRV